VTLGSWRRSRLGGSLLPLIAMLLVAACTAVTTVPSTAPSSSSAAATASAGSPLTAVAARTLPNGATAGVDDTTWALADRMMAATYTPDSTDAMTAALARAGVATFSDPADQTPEVAITGTQSPFELLDFQAHALAVGAWAHTSWSGAELDQVLPVPDGPSGLAPTSAVLAGYVAAVDTPGAQLARALMAGQNLLDPATLDFPGVVLVLFASDIASASASTAGPTLSPSPAAQIDPRLLALAQTGPGTVTFGVADDSGGPCSTASAFIQGAIDRLFNALKIQAQNNIVLAVLAAIWNWIVDKLQKFVENIITTVTSLILDYVRTIAGEIASVSEQITSVLPFAVAVSVTGPSGDVFDLTSASGPLTGAYVVNVTAGDLPDWPDVLKDCAQVAGIQLPDFHSKNVPLTWDSIEVVAPGDPLVAPVPISPTDASTDASGKAGWNFQTSADPGDPSGPVESQLDIMHVTVHRPELDQVRAALTRALLGFIPPILQDTVLYLIGKVDPAIAGIQSSVNALLDRPGEAGALIRFHGKNQPTPVPTASPAPSGETACTATLSTGSHTGTLTDDQATIIGLGTIDQGDSDSFSEHGTAPLTVSVGVDGTLSASFVETIQHHEVYNSLGTRDETRVRDGTLSGTACNLIVAFIDSTTTSCIATGAAAIYCSGVTGHTVQLGGLVPPLPLGPPNSTAGGQLTWTLSSEHSFADLGMEGSGEVQDMFTVTISN
jgi:hypothetical protein